MRSEIILDDQPRIILPAERTKSSRAHTVPLSSAATRILKPYLANGDAVFNGFAAFSAAKAELEHVPPQLNRGDSRKAKDRRVYRR